MYSVGYNDNKSFRKVFRKFTGITPSDYKLRYSRLMN
jgi:YesN/AraC family two-component response regulator